jgi:hypothetical protein
MSTGRLASGSDTIGRASVSRFTMVGISSKQRDREQQ